MQILSTNILLEIKEHFIKFKVHSMTIWSSSILPDFNTSQNKYPVHLRLMWKLLNLLSKHGKCAKQTDIACHFRQKRFRLSESLFVVFPAQAGTRLAFQPFNIKDAKCIATEVRWPICYSDWTRSTNFHYRNFTLGRLCLV